MSNRNRRNVADTKDRLRKKVAIKQGPKKIVLCMIVKNESRNMHRLLDSLKSIIDLISIVDTGSTDNTEEVIIDWAKKNKIPATVHHETFKNFAYNRTHSFDMARKAYPEADYALLSDADFVWDIDVGSKFDKSLLIDHKYLIEQYNKSLTYWNVRLLSTKVNFSSVGTTHEYWLENKAQDYAGEIRTAKIKTLMIDDREDGGCKEDKFDRDERLLKEGLDDPETPKGLKTRYKFYLAQTLKDMQRYTESIDWYNKRVEDKGWAEEVYYAKFQIGFNYEQLGWKNKHTISLLGKSEHTEDDIKHLEKWNADKLAPNEIRKKSNQYFTDASVNYLAAYNYRKTRAEALYYLVRMYRVLGMNEQVFDFASKGNKITYPDSDTLFIERSCYTYNFDYEISIAAYYIPEKKDLGRQAISRLLQLDDLPNEIREQVEHNSRFYL